MSELGDYGIDLETLREMYREWQNGVSKTHLELKYLNKTESHGKLFSSLVRRYLAEETERTHPLAEEVNRLRQENLHLRLLLTTHGIDLAELPRSLASAG